MHCFCTIYSCVFDLENWTVSTIKYLSQIKYLPHSPGSSVDDQTVTTGAWCLVMLQCMLVSRVTVTALKYTFNAYYIYIY